MSVLDEIVLWPDERLKVECTPIDNIDESIKALSERMLEAMYEADGVGLAAPQLGETLQMCVIDVDWDDETGENKNPYVLINPQVVTADGEPNLGSEGCLSFPGISCEIERPSHVVVRAYNLDGDLMQYEARDNLMAVCLQHEIDHLHGKTMLDHLTLATRAQALKEYEAALEAGARPGQTAASEQE